MVLVVGGTQCRANAKCKTHSSHRQGQVRVTLCHHSPQAGFDSSLPALTAALYFIHPLRAAAGIGNGRHLGSREQTGKWCEAVYSGSLTP